jgi:G2/mitotic-specific cyclin-B, other
MSGQAEINDKMRAILIDWLIEVHHKFKLQPETLFITARIIDKYLELEQVSKSRLQLVGVTALLLASKYEEIYPPELKDFVFITDKAYNKEDVLQMEFSILSSLSFDLTFPTTHRFIERYSRLIGCDSRVTNFAYFLSELALIDIRMLQYNSSVTAASALILAYKIVTSGIENAFSLQNRTLDSYLSDTLGFSESELTPCMQDLHSLQQRGVSSSL